MNDKPIIVFNDRFRTILIKMYFPMELKEEEIGLIDILPTMLVNTSKKYPEEEEFLKQFMKNYIINFSVGIQEVGKQGFFRVTLVLPDPIYLKENHLEEAISFALDALYQPNITNGKFDSFLFEREKKSLLMDIDNAKKDVRRYSFQRFLEIIDEDGQLKNNIYNHKEQIQSFTPRELFEVYKKNIQTKRPITFVFGNVDEKEINSLFDKYLYKQNLTQNHYQKNYNFFQEKRKLKQVEEKKPYNQSCVMLGYKIKDLKEDELPLVSLINGLLSSQSSNLLSKKIREEDGIAYATGSNFNRRYGIFLLECLIYRENKQKAIAGMQEVLKSLQDPKLIRPLLENLKERYRLGLFKNQDYKFEILGDEIAYYMGFDKKEKDKYEIISKIEAEDIIAFIPKFQLDTIYYLEGEKDGK